MAAHGRMRNKFTEDEKYHNLISWLICDPLPPPPPPNHHIQATMYYVENSDFGFAWHLIEIRRHIVWHLLSGIIMWMSVVSRNCKALSIPEALRKMFCLFACAEILQLRSCRAGQLPINTVPGQA